MNAVAAAIYREMYDDEIKTIKNHELLWKLRNELTYSNDIVLVGREKFYETFCKS